MSASGGPAIDRRKPAILIASGPWPAEHWAAPIRESEPDRPIWCWPDMPNDGALNDIRYLMAWHPPAEALTAAPALDVIFSLGAGIDHLSPGRPLPDVPIARIISDDLTQRMTEWVTLQVLMHHRQQRSYDRQQAASEWRERDQPPAAKVRVGIMGLGVLGRDAAEVLVRLGFDVAGWSRTPREVTGVSVFSGDGELGSFLARTDILVSLLPLTDQTRGILNRALFSQLATDGALGGPVLINAGRGGSQVEEDIIGALDDGTLIGASLDVFEPEPLTPESPLWRHPNVIVTPHAAAFSSPAALARLVHAQIQAFEAGEPLQGVVDPASGY